MFSFQNHPLTHLKFEHTMRSSKPVMKQHFKLFIFLAFWLLVVSGERCEQVTTYYSTLLYCLCFPQTQSNDFCRICDLGKIQKIKKIELQILLFYWKMEIRIGKFCDSILFLCMGGRGGGVTLSLRF